MVEIAFRLTWLDIDSWEQFHLDRQVGGGTILMLYLHGHGGFAGGF